MISIFAFLIHHCLGNIDALNVQKRPEFETPAIAALAWFAIAKAVMKMKIFFIFPSFGKGILDSLYSTQPAYLSPLFSDH